MSAPIPETEEEDSPGTSRVRAALYILPFLLLGIGNIILVQIWGAEPLWVFVMLPPIIFVTVIGWIAFKYGVGESHEA